MTLLNIGRKNNPNTELQRAAAAWDPFREMRQMLGWDPFLELGIPSSAAPGTYVPSFEVRETPQSYLFKADLPGVQEKDLDITLNEGRLIVSGKREAEKKEENETYYLYERSYGTFQRAFTLPAGVDRENVRAELKAGELTIVVPKMARAQAKQIPVQGETKARS